MTATLSIPILPSSDISSHSPYFRARFNNQKTESKIYEFEYWKEIQSKDIDTTFEVYQKGPYIQKKFPAEATIIFQLIENGGLLGVAAEAHEKWEVLEYLKRGYSLEDIGNGKAYEEYKPTAHAEARFKELRLYQFWYKQLFKDRPPAMRAFLFVHPVLQIIVQDIYNVEVTAGIMTFLVSELKGYENIVRSEKLTKSDIEKSMKFFEKTGYNYGNKRGLFLKRGLTFLDSIH